MAPARTCVVLSFILSAASAVAAIATPLRMSSNAQKVAVIGTTGRLGRQAVLQLSKASVPVRCLIRRPIDPTAKPSIEKESSSAEVAAFLAGLPNVEMVRGDVTDKESLSELLEGCSAVLALHGAGPTGLKSLVPMLNPESDSRHAKQINYVGVKNIIEAAKNSGSCKRIVRVTGKGENPWSFFSILINMLGSMAKAWNYEGEELLRQCKDVDYTIVRPGVMGRDNCPNGKVLAIADNGGDLPVSAVPHEQIASLCIECLQYPNAARSTLTAMNVEPGTGEETYAPLLANVKPDTRDFPGSLLEEHKKAARTGAAALFAIFIIFSQGCLLLGKKLVLGLLAILNK
uniref:NAD(P)-binding domain-containing protein n=1 Tax=Trieres chinensis TaxID=1514140 RepID=A0A7S2EFU0_TRICV|mmetsp:Transcript_21140/g.42633  ORF Transcript_21140/g.42633 Transcript_21140/m.42633 type:complete len:345 (+) Transcript_21140:56-1090(+)|eukprot:CAMPEP_0183308224 /NCGR_PEP_ID=MMETSP0160_2-20130417/20515_1 /TAXON_ID=2839 ORGANISM="Odontella Sinensis, Strain Grunow 1884" /NCGR_SAMPLE_ID=MMETSP0160_2 /ASSEMBLY_ACC=CAM_ASM_000250 /LENGTH=344 /DNA_ID=CAMNT_0025472011 /DNA_START=50 /DNA_END=1084 /DNA_ORIENTATION=+